MCLGADEEYVADVAVGRFAYGLMKAGFADALACGGWHFDPAKPQRREKADKMDWPRRDEKACTAVDS